MPSASASTRCRTKALQRFCAHALDTHTHARTHPFAATSPMRAVTFVQNPPHKYTSLVLCRHRAFARKRTICGADDTKGASLKHSVHGQTSRLFVATLKLMCETERCSFSASRHFISHLLTSSAHVLLWPLLVLPSVTDPASL